MTSYIAFEISRDDNDNDDKMFRTDTDAEKVAGAKWFVLYELCVYHTDRETGRWALGTVPRAPAPFQFLCYSRVHSCVHCSHLNSHFAVPAGNDAEWLQLYNMLAGCANPDPEILRKNVIYMHLPEGISISTGTIITQGSCDATNEEDAQEH